MTHGSLFSGIGGFDLAAEWMGWKNSFHCEWNEFGQQILKHYWPEAKSYHDITKTDFTTHRGSVDIITGGFPCQPYSVAGKQKGTADERHLWPEMLRAIREVQPRYVVGENVPGLVNWSEGLVFEQVLADLETEGHKVTLFLLPACSQDAPHKRERIWFVAYADGARRQKFDVAQKPNNQELDNRDGHDVTYTTSKRSERGETRFNKLQSSFEKELHGRGGNEQFRSEGWGQFPTQSPVCNGDDGFSTQMDGITFSKWRNESIKAGGNAIVPQVAYQIFKAIEQFEIIAA